MLCLGKGSWEPHSLSVENWTMRKTPTEGEYGLPNQNPDADYYLQRPKMSQGSDTKIFQEQWNTTEEIAKEEKPMLLLYLNESYFVPTDTMTIALKNKSLNFFSPVTFVSV